jgi:hypothetical protein
MDHHAGALSKTSEEKSARAIARIGCEHRDKHLSGPFDPVYFDDGKKTVQPRLTEATRRPARLFGGLVPTR